MPFFFSFFLVSASSHAYQLYAYDDFNNPLREHSSMDEVGGGDGWLDAWNTEPMNRGCSAGAFLVSDARYPQQGLVAQIGYEGWSFDPNDSFHRCLDGGGVAKRTLSQTLGDGEREVWLSFWAHAGNWFDRNPTENLKIGLSLLYANNPAERYSSDVEKFSIGANAANVANGAWVAASELGNPSLETVLVPHQNQAHHFLVKIVFGQPTATVMVWSDQTLGSTAPYDHLATVVRVPAFTFNRIGLISNRTDGVPFFDDIALADTYEGLFANSNEEHESNDTQASANPYSPGFHGRLRKLSDSECYYLSQGPGGFFDSACYDKDYVSFTVSKPSSQVQITTRLLGFMLPMGRTMVALSLYDAQGRLVSSQDRFSLNEDQSVGENQLAAQLSAGTYYLRIQYISNYAASFSNGYTLDIATY